MYIYNIYNTINKKNALNNDLLYEKLYSKTKSILFQIFITFLRTLIHFHIYDHNIIGTLFSHDSSDEYFEQTPCHMNCNDMDSLRACG